MDFLYLIVALLITLTIHESAHALVAYYLGDSTAKFENRISLNPINHLDPVGTMVFLMTQMVGWGKPVPVDSRNFRYPIRDSALTALAGPLSNFILAFSMILLWKYVGEYLPDFLFLQIQYVFHVSLFLGIFNMLPFPPLDGSKVLGLFVPKSLQRYYLLYLSEGVKYFIAILFVDVLVLRPLFSFSIFGYVLSKMSVIGDFLLAIGS